MMKKKQAACGMKFIKLNWKDRLFALMLLFVGLSRTWWIDRNYYFFQVDIEKCWKAFRHGVMKERVTNR